jgi:hypothetical protein
MPTEWNDAGMINVLKRKNEHTGMAVVISNETVVK